LKIIVRVDGRKTRKNSIEDERSLEKTLKIQSFFFGRGVEAAREGFTKLNMNMEYVKT
jgi:hypothetical protein